MRLSEWISAGFLALFLFLALVRRLARRNRLRIAALALIGLSLVWLGLHRPFLRDWIPVLLMLIVYWQGGSFYSTVNPKLQKYLEDFEAKVYFSRKLSPNDYWEVAYFFCYPLVPAAVLTLKQLSLSARMDFFWTVVLPPTFLCHLVVSFYQTLPPWRSHYRPKVERIFRKLNSIVIRHASIQINTFPSAHVAASVAIALAMIHLHFIAGLIFLFLATSITIGTVAGRYHYTADAVWGTLLALIWYLAMFAVMQGRRILGPYSNL